MVVYSDMSLENSYLANEHYCCCTSAILSRRLLHFTVELRVDVTMTKQGHVTQDKHSVGRHVAWSECDRDLPAI